MKNLIILNIMIICLLSQVKVNAENNNIFNNFIDYLKKEYSDSQGEPLNVLNYNQNKLLIEKKDNIKKGRELLIYTKKKNIPHYLTDPINVAIVRDELDEGYLAESIKDINKNEEPLIVSRPTRPIIYVPLEGTYIHYERLVNSLIQNGFIVKEVNKFDKNNGIKNYGVFLHIDNYEDQPQITIESLFFNNILYKENLYPFTKLEQINNNNLLTDKTFKSDDFNKNNNKGHKMYKLPYNYSRLRVADIDGNVDKEFILLGNESLGVYTFKNNKFELITMYKFRDKNLVPVQLYTMDVNGDKREEIIITMGQVVDDFGFTDTEIYSMLLSFKDNSLIPVGEKIPYYLRIIENEMGKKILLGQRKGEYSPFEGKILYFSWDAVNNKLINKGAYGPAKNIYSLYQFNFIKDNPEKVIIIEPNNYIRIYDYKTSKPVVTLETSCGDFNITPIKIKLKDFKYLGGFDRKITYQEFYTPRRFEVNSDINGQIFTIKKNKTNHFFDFTKLSLKGEPADSIIAVKPENDYLNITWQSKEIYSDILDFAIGEIDERPVIYILVRNLDGYGVMFIE